MKVYPLATALAFLLLATTQAATNSIPPVRHPAMNGRRVVGAPGGPRAVWPPCSTVGVDTAAEFITFSNCFFQFVRSSTIARRPLDDQARAAQYDAEFQAAVTRLTDLLNQGLPSVAPSDLQKFEESIPIFVSEVNAFYAVFDPNLAPPTPLTLAEWQDHQQTGQEQTVDTIAAKIKWFIALFPESLRPYVADVIDIVLEIIKVFF